MENVTKEIYRRVDCPIRFEKVLGLEFGTFGFCNGGELIVEKL